MRVARLRLFNWLRYQGAHDLKLDGTVYAVTGAFDHDERRSNWAGKTSMLEAIRFALYGVHRAPREDDWITHGEPSGWVEAEFTDGLIVRRERRRGSATRLTAMDSQSTATGDAAQTVIEQRIGLSREDFEATCWMGQKALSRFVLARPAERFEVVSGWAGLGPLQRCEEAARAKLAEASAALARAEAQAQAAERVVLDMRATLGLEAVAAPDAVRVAAEHLAEASAQLAAVVALDVEAADAKLAAAHARRARDDQQAEFEQIAEALREARAEFEALPEADAEAATRAFADAKAAMVAAGAEAKTKATLARGEFDGRCPVGGIVCPATGDLNRMAAKNRVEHKRALDVYDAACKREALARAEQQDATRAQQAREKLLGRRDALRQRWQALKAVLAEPIPEAPTVPEAQALVSDCRARYREVEQNRSDATAVLKHVEGAFAERDRARAEVEVLKAQAMVYRAALRVFGRQGAQQRVAEAALSEIRDGANALLREAGIDLSVEMTWARDGQGLAATCDSCGAAFPASQRVKRCERCGAERGQKVVERLDVELSDRSGAAEDLAGAALQLAATAWLRAERGVQWSVALIDEPFGALDEANRRAFASHLTKMLRGRFGFEQALIVAHSPDVLDAMPARVVVRADEYGSKLEVA